MKTPIRIRIHSVLRSMMLRETTAIRLACGAAIFVGGLFKGLLDRIAEKESWDAERKERSGNTGTLLASGLIAGEAFVGILFAALAFNDVALPEVFARPAYLASVASMAILGAVLVTLPRRRERTGS